MTYPDGAIYEGAFQDDLADGEGKITYTDGSTYEGDWVAGVIEGMGRATYPNGVVYEGAFRNARAAFDNNHSITLISSTSVSATSSGERSYESFSFDFPVARASNTNI